MQSSLEHDALSLHFVMAYPNLQRDSSKNAALPVYSKEASEASAASRQKFLSVLSFLDSKKLNEEERYTYDLLCDRLALDLEESDFSYYEATFPRPPACRASCFYYLQNIRFIPLTTWKPIFPSCSPFPITCRGLLMNPKKAQPGFYGKEDAKKCTAVPRNPHKGGAFLRHALFTDDVFFQTCISFTKGLLTAKQQSQYEAQNQSLLSKSVLPAWQLLADGLEQLSDTGRTRGGLSQKPDGRQYYAWLVKESTGSPPFHGSALFAPSKTVSENLQRDETDADHLSGADRRYA